MSFDSLLNTTCSSTRPSSAGQSASGHHRFTNAAVLTVEPCRLDPKGGKELIQDGQQVIADFTLFLRQTADITEKDIVTVGSSTYEVKLVRNAAGQSHHQECDVKLVRV